MSLLSLPSILTALGCFLGGFILRWMSIYLKRRELIMKNGCQDPPSLPSIDPFFGLDSVFRAFRSVKENKRNLSLKEQLDTYGFTFRSNQYGRTILFTIEPENLQAIFSTDFESYGVQPIRLFAFKPLAGKGVMTTDGAMWAHSRALIRPTFSRTQIGDLSALSGHVTRLIELIPQDGSTVNLQPLFARLALDSSTEFLFGESVGSLTPSPAVDAQQFLKAYNYGQAGVGRRIHLPQWNFLTRDQKFWQSCEVARDFVDKYVTRAMLQRESPNRGKKLVLAEELAKETTDKGDIRNQLLNVFLPAHDATAVALTNVFFNLSRHPEVWAKLRSEILNALKEEITFENLKSLRYLQYVVNETFRLYPVTGTMARIALRDTILPTGGGAAGNSPVFVKKGTMIRTSFYALHRRKDIYGSDADRWKPERWNTLRPRHWGYLPFGGGPRVCPGQQLALTEIGYTITRILHKFQQIECRDPVWEFVEEFKITTESKNGAKVALKSV